MKRDTRFNKMKEIGISTVDAGYIVGKLTITAYYLNDDYNITQVRK